MSETLRERLTRQALAYMKDEYQDELGRICPDEWDQERIDKMVQAQLDYSRYILEAIGIQELQNCGALQTHIGTSIVELRSRVHQEIAADRRKDTR